MILNSHHPFYQLYVENQLDQNLRNKMKFRNIVILEKDVNKKGDLFGRLMSDLFHTLGYDEPRLNIHKSDREIDLTSVHRTEDKVAIAECKAYAETI
jgi:hypothetical protein